MKLLHITPWYAPAWATGGTAVAATSLCEGLVELDCDVTVYTTVDAGEYNSLSDKTFYDLRNGVQVTYFSGGFFGLPFRRAALSFSMCFSIIRKIKEFDLIHIHSTRHIYGFFTMIMCKWHNIPYVVTPHASIMDYWMNEIGYPWLKKFYSLLVDRHVLKSASSIHYLTQFEADTSYSQARNNNFFVLANGIDMKRINKANNLRCSNTLKLLSVGRIHPQKNTLELVKAVCSLKKYDLKLDLIGSIDDREYFKKCISEVEKTGATNVNFVGTLPIEEVIDRYQHYDIFCMPSVVEGVSMALIEAASRGLPALITEGVGNHQEVMADEAGLLTDFDSESIAKNLTKILEDRSLLDSMSLNAYSSAAKRYNIDVICEKLLVHYSTILESNARSKTNRL